MAGFARAAARILRPGGHAILHQLNPFSLWEWLGYVARRDWPNARTVGRRRIRQFVIGGQSITHTLHFADDAYRRFFARDFKRDAVLGLGIVRPPHTVRRVPQSLGRALEWLDVRSGRLPLVRNAGRFWVLDLERRSS
jgi:SAM-dependent methyltransferase